MGTSVVDPVSLLLSRMYIINVIFQLLLLLSVDYESNYNSSWFAYNYVSCTIFYIYIIIIINAIKLDNITLDKFAYVQIYELKKCSHFSLNALRIYTFTDRFYTLVSVVMKYIPAFFLQS